MKSKRIFLPLTILILMTFACGGPAATQQPTEISITEPTTEAPTEAATEAPVATEPPETEIPTFATEEPGPLSGEEQFEQIQRILAASMKGSIAYNAPSQMQVDETVTIELLLNPKLTEEQLEEQISEPGAVASRGDVTITPLMQALLVPDDVDAFSVLARPDADHSVQMIHPTETTKWSWDITARKDGQQGLTIYLFNLVKYDNQDHWMKVAEYPAHIVVEVTLASRLKRLNWIWILGTFLTLMVISAFWQRSRHRKKRPEQLGTTGTEPAAHSVEGHIFISYRRSDSADIVGRIYDRLVEEFGREPIFKDVDSIPLGADFREYLDRKVSECDVFLAVIGDRWTAASDSTAKKRLEDPEDFVRIEIESALGRGIPIIPLLVRGAQMPAEEELPTSLRKLVYRNGIPIRHDPDFRNDMKRLISALEQYLRRARRP